MLPHSPLFFLKAFDLIALSGEDLAHAQEKFLIVVVGVPDFPSGILPKELAVLALVLAAGDDSTFTILDH